MTRRFIFWVAITSTQRDNHINFNRSFLENNKRKEL